MITDNMIDDLGILNQQIAQLEAQARTIKQWYASWLTRTLSPA